MPSTVTVPILELLGQPAPGSEVDALAGEVGFGAGAEAGAERGVDGQAFGQGGDRPC